MKSYILDTLHLHGVQISTDAGYHPSRSDRVELLLGHVVNVLPLADSAVAQGQLQLRCHPAEPLTNLYPRAEWQNPLPPPPDA